MDSQNMDCDPAKATAGKATDVSSVKNMAKPAVPDDQPNDNFRPGERAGHERQPGRDVLGE